MCVWGGGVRGPCNRSWRKRSFICLAGVLLLLRVSRREARLQRTTWKLLIASFVFFICVCVGGGHSLFLTLLPKGSCVHFFGSVITHTWGLGLGEHQIVCEPNMLLNVCPMITCCQRVLTGVWFLTQDLLPGTSCRPNWSVYMRSGTWCGLGQCFNHQGEP